MARWYNFLLDGKFVPINIPAMLSSETNAILNSRYPCNWIRTSKFHTCKFTAEDVKNYFVALKLTKEMPLSYADSMKSSE